MTPLACESGVHGCLRAASPLHLGGMPPVVDAAIAVLAVIAVAFLIHIGWKWMSTPFARHACRLCAKEACGYCEREERSRISSDYARQAREGKESRAAVRELLKGKGEGSNV